MQESVGGVQFVVYEKFIPNYLRKTFFYLLLEYNPKQIYAYWLV